MKIMIRDLPGDVTEQALRDYLAPYGDIESVTLTNAGNDERASATVELPVSEAVAEAVCNKINQKHLDGHALRAEPLLFFG